MEEAEEPLHRPTDTMRQQNRFIVLVYLFGIPISPGLELSIDTTFPYPGEISTTIYLYWIWFDY